MKLSFFLCADSIGGAEISTSLIIGSLNKDIEIAKGFLLCPDSISCEFNDHNLYCTSSANEFISLLKEEAISNVIISTNRNIGASTQYAPYGNHTCVFRNVPSHDLVTRTLKLDSDAWQLEYESWDSIVSKIPDNCNVITLSDSQSNILEKDFGLGSIIIPNPVDVYLGDTTGNHIPQVHIWSRPVPWKRTDLTRNAFEKARVDSSLLIFGDNKSNILLKEKEVNMGWKPEPWRYANLGDIVISNAENEAYARDAFEGFMRGCLVICVEGTPAASIVMNTGSGDIIPKNCTIEQLANSIENLCNKSHEERVQLGIKARTTVESMVSPFHVKKNWSRLYPFI